MISYLAFRIRKRLWNFFNFFNRRAQHAQAARLKPSFDRLRLKRIEIRSFINLGAGAGLDTDFFQIYWPDMQVLLIDMDSQFVENYQQAQESDSKISYEICAAGRVDGDGYFSKTSTVGGALTQDGSDADAKKTPIVSVDTLVARHNLKPPYFLKFDTHGVETDILAGAEETLKNTHLIMMEVYNFKFKFLEEKNLTFDEMSLHMKSLGFRCVDICDALFRPGDAALWQLHMLFIRDDHPIWKVGSYSAPPQ